MTNAPIIFTRVGYTSTGRPWYKLVHAKGHTFGRRFTIGGKKRTKKATT